MKNKLFLAALLGATSLPCSAFAQEAPPEPPAEAAPPSAPGAPNDMPPAPPAMRDRMPGDDARPGDRMNARPRPRPEMAPRPRDARPMDGGPRGDMGEGPAADMPPAPTASAISVANGFVFVVQGDTLFQFALKDLRLVQRARLEAMTPPDMPGMRPQPGMGGPRPGMMQPQGARPEPRMAPAPAPRR